MSFGDISSGRSREPSTLLQGQLSSPMLTPDAELRGTLKALAANNAALRRTSQQLRSPNPAQHPPLNRIRELREQNRDIARAAAGFASRVDSPEARAQFQFLIEEFSDALRESVKAETDTLEMASTPSSTTTKEPRNLTENQVAVQLDEERKVLHPQGPSETDPLISGSSHLQTANEAAVLREIHSNDTFVRERNAVLTEIQSSVDDVNSIFKDLAVMVGDQQSQVDYIDVAVGDAAENVSHARRELLKTQRRREKRKSVFFCTLLSIAAIIALFLIIVLS